MPYSRYRRVKKKPAPQRKKPRYRRKLPQYSVGYVRPSDNNIGLPRKKIVKLTYCQTNSIVSSTGLLARNVYRLNSLFDPDQTGIGHQPFGFDQWANLYDVYTVLGAKITVTFSNRTTGTVPTLCGIIIDRDTTLSDTDCHSYIEKTRGQGWTTLPINTNTQRTLTSYYSTKKTFGITDVMDDHQFSAGFAASPANGAFASVVVQASDLSATTGTVDCLVRIEYVVALTSPKDLSQS